MTGFLARRAAGLVAVLVALSAVVFLLQSVIPADPVRAMVGASADASTVEAARVRLGLDDPLPTQYWHFLTRALHGDLGASLHTRRPVSADLGAFLPASLELALTAGLLALLVGGLLGILTAGGRGKKSQLVLVALASAPPFLLALGLLLTLYAGLHVLPGSGRLTPGLVAPTGPTAMITVDALLHGQVAVWSDALAHLVMPAVCLAIGPAVAIARTLRSSLQGVLREDYVRTARAKALPERTVLLRHGLRNSLSAPLTMAGLQVGLLMGGVVVVESVFAWPGVGLYTARSIQTIDFPAVAGTTLVLGAGYVVLNALVDLAQVWADPRLRRA
ncbi:MAG: binding-protein-dependent transport system inner rane component [Frankiales bacterium]|nr:binding-protein-dependent transport system inner rane component [Frankiales bacterium]